MFRYNRIAAGVLAALLHQACFAQGDVKQGLIEQGLFWQARDDNSRASEAWNKLLQVDQTSSQALYGLATIELRANRLDGARDYLQRMKQLNATDPLVTQLEQDILLDSDRNKILLEEARQAMVATEIELAVDKYQQALGGRRPVGEVGRDYYSLLGYTANGLPEAIQNLQRLRVQSPDDATLELALARHLARNEATRIDGIRRLSKLSENRAVGSDAAESWRDALTWLGPPQSDTQALFTDYLKKHPNDAEIREQLEQGVVMTAQASRTQKSTSRPDPLRRRTNEAMKQLDSGDPVAARAEFEAVLAKRPNDSEALGGLGVLAMQEGRWQEASDYLARARRGNAAWQSSLSTAQYWVKVEAAQTAYQAGDLTEARRLANQATRQAPHQTAPKVLLANIMLDEGKTDQAVKAYRSILQRHAGDPGALLGLSRAMRLSGDDAAARKLLEDALAKNPDSPWLRYDLAQLYQEMGLPLESRRVIDGLPASSENKPDVLYVNALLASNKQQWAQTLAVLDRVPVSQRTAPMNQLYAYANRRMQISDAVNMARAGQKSDAIQWLEQIKSDAPNDFEVTSAVARAYVDIGEPARGLALLKPLRAPGASHSVDATIAYAGLLLASEQELEASLLLRQLQDARLTTSQRKRVEELSDNYRIRKANQLTARGDVDASYKVLSPVIQRHPNNLAAQGALARLYVASGEKEKAFEIYQTLLQADPDNPEVHLGLAQLAQQTGNTRQAQQEAEIAVALAPEDSRVIAPAARIYRDIGRSGDAVELLEKAIALQTPAVAKPSTEKANASDQMAQSDASTTSAMKHTAAPSELAQELEALYQERSAQVRVGFAGRSRNGESGTSKLTEYQTPIEVTFPVGNGRMSFRATPVSLSAGSIGAVPTYTGPANLLQYSPLAVKDEGQRGIGLSLGYQRRGMEFDAGVTPLGFQQVNFTGGALFTGTLDDAGTVGYRVDISRRPVTDSVLSFAGRKYENLGLEWGGVTATGARVSLSKSFGASGIYGSAAWHTLRGHNVASNQRTEVNAGAYFSVINEPNAKLTAGVNLNATFFSKNMGHFTYGSGGYFSPEHYYGLSFPVTWAQRSGRFSYRIDGSIGLQQFKQADVAVFPNNPELQAYAEQMAGSNNLFGSGFFPGSSKTGISYAFKAVAEYQANPHLVFGAAIGADNAEDYRQWAGGLYLRYYFYPQRNVTALDLPVEPYRSPYGITYGR